MWHFVGGFVAGVLSVAVLSRMYPMALTSTMVLPASK